MKLYHYTSRDTWDKIEGDWFLDTRTHSIQTRFPDITYDSLTEEQKKIIGDKKYIVAIGDPFDKSRNSSWLLDLLWVKTTPEVCIWFYIKDTEWCFVREHALCCPKLFIDLYGKDLRTWLNYNTISAEEIELYKKHVIEYLNSAVPLSEYTWQFKVPEYRIPYTIPVSNLLIWMDNH